MTPSIFFDLETTDTEPIGQILNFCFILIDENWNPISECSGRIRISRLELPRAAAILANRVNVMEHQQQAEYSEHTAMLAIEKFLGGVVAKYGDYKIPIIGFNSAKFDTKFLRTSLIRNGIDPYFKLITRDLLFLARKLSITDPSFPRVSHADEGKLSLRLETLAKIHGALVGKQSHDSREDVFLTIRLAKIFFEKYAADVRTFDAYEPRNARRGSVVLRAEPNYDLKGTRFVSNPMALLDGDNRYALWVNLQQYKEAKSNGKDISACVWWFKFDGREFHCVQGPVDEYVQLAKEAILDLGKVTLRNFFSPKVCDIELDITRLDREQIRLLKLACSGHTAKISNSDTKKVLARFKLSNYTYGGSQDSQVDDLLRGYADYRYGGKFKLDRKVLNEKGELADCFGPSLSQLKDEVSLALKDAGEEERALLNSLLMFYNNSDISRVTGTQMGRP